MLCQVSLFSVESARIEETDAVMRGDGSKTRFLLYGAYGYTGRLAAEIAVAKGLDVVLAGRNQDALAELISCVCQHA
jgi:hypothetical protein